MRKQFFLLALLLASLAAYAQQPSLGVNLKDGSDATYSLDNIQKITFSNGNVVISTTDGDGGLFAIQDISKMYFYSASSVMQRAAEKEFFVWSPLTQELTVRCAAGTPIRVYSANGLTVLTAIQSVSGAPVSLATLPKGIYLVEAADKSTKILRR